MVKKLTVKRELSGAGDRKTIRASALNGESLRAGNDITVWRKQVPSDKVFWFGHGGNSRTSGNTVHVKGDIVNVASGASIDGELVLAVTDSDGVPLAKRTFSDLESLREAIPEDRSNRPMMPAMGPVAGSDRYVEVRINADSTSDGDEIDPDASELKLFHTSN